MSAKKNFAVLIFVFAVALTSCAKQAASHEPFFDETGHFVHGEFLNFYNATPNPQLIYGAPITEQFISHDGKTVQYFERARFELTTGDQGKAAVKLTPIGLALHQSAAQLEPQNPAACEMIAGIRVCYDFLDFYKNNGAFAQFGDPISSAQEYSGLYVQYFENARFEWRTDGAQPRVEISPLGRVYFEYLAEDLSHLDPARQTDATINPVLSLDVRAFVADAITQKSGEQTVSVLVLGQSAQRVANATINISVRLPDGSTQNIVTSTNDSGLAAVNFSFQNQSVGEIVQIEVVVEFQGITGRSKTSFRIWY